MKNALTALVLLSLTSCGTLMGYGQNFVANAAYDLSEVSAKVGDVATIAADLSASDAEVQARINEMAEDLSRKTGTQEAGGLAALAAAVAGAGVSFWRNAQRRKRGEPVTVAEASRKESQ